MGVHSNVVVVVVVVVVAGLRRRSGDHGVEEGAALRNFGSGVVPCTAARPPAITLVPRQRESWSEKDR